MEMDFKVNKVDYFISSILPNNHNNGKRAVTQADDEKKVYLIIFHA